MDQLGNQKTVVATDYTYDVNGNLSLDKNKDISVISYNHLNLPYRVTVPNKGTITYIYDATGNKLEKRVVEGDKDTKTNYLGNFVYENNKLQFLGQEEGRVRAVYDSTGVIPHYVYDYFVKDHLGNTRMVLTEEWERQVYPAATLETASVETEKLYYQINPGAIVPKPVSLNADYPNNNGIPNPGNPQPNANSTSMYRLNAATGDKMGLGIMLKVMSGDTVSILGKSFWHNNAQTTPDNNYQIPLNDLLLALTGSGTVLNGKGITTTILGTQPITPGALQEFLNNVPQNGTAPKAYINWILLDEQLKPITNNSGFDGVDAQSEIVKTHTRSVNINRNGYLYVYASNQSNLDVFFDNLQVVHARGPLLEETHYYPFGLTMAGISSKAAGKLENRYKFNKGTELQNHEFSDGTGLDWYATPLRSLDPQLGRWWQIDSKPDYAMSLYSSMGNNPILYNDPLGDTVIRGGGFWANAVEGLKEGWRSTKSFVRSLGTAEGWSNMAESFNTLGASDPISLMKKAEMVDGMVAGIKNIPNMTKDEWGHAIGFGTEKIVEGALLSKGAGLVKNAVPKSTTLFRAGSADELADVAANGLRTNPQTGYETGKLFATTSNDAAQFGKNNFMLDGTPNFIMKVTVPRSVMKTATKFEADGMKAVSIPAEQLQKVKIVTPMNFSNLPKH